MQGVPGWVTNDAATQKAYDALVEKVCPCVVVVQTSWVCVPKTSSA
jgi:hypothetical protein